MAKYIDTMVSGHAKYRMLSSPSSFVGGLEAWPWMARLQSRENSSLLKRLAKSLMVNFKLPLLDSTYPNWILMMLQFLWTSKTVILSMSPLKNTCSHSLRLLRSSHDWLSIPSLWATINDHYKSVSLSRTFMLVSRSWTWRTILWGDAAIASSTMSRRLRILFMISRWGIWFQRRNKLVGLGATTVQKKLNYPKDRDDGEQLLECKGVWGIGANMSMVDEAHPKLLFAAIVCSLGWLSC